MSEGETRAVEQPSTGLESPWPVPRARRRVRWARWFLISGVVALTGAFSAFSALEINRYWLRSMPAPRASALPRASFHGGSPQVRMPNGNLLGEVGVYSSELTAYLRFEYLQGETALNGRPVLMISKETGAGPEYRLYVGLPNDLLAGSTRLAELEINRFIPDFRVISRPTSQIREWEQETRLFEAAYDQPVRERLLQLPESELTSAVAKFILFKVKTDRRVREQVLTEQKVVSPEQSLQYAADMIAVAKFYQIPLDMLLGVGAMENNYLDVRGDLHHAVWKRRAQPGDIVLRRRRGRVLVSNYSLGRWQITRETLRYAHTLFLEDDRDYSKLPPRLRPPRRLNLNNVSSDVLTTYAGLLLRHLLDKFNGDVAKAEGAYNGGVRNPNMKYAQGVSMVAKYAHRVLSMAAGRKGNAVEETPIKVREGEHDNTAS